jgi:hypothetical protein
VNLLAFGAIFGISIFGGLSIEKFERAIAKDFGSKMTGEHRSVIVRAKISLETLKGVVPRVTVYAHDFSTQSLPLHVDTKRSQYGRVKRLQVVLKHFNLKGLPVESLDVNLPNVRFDLAYAMSQHHLWVGKSGIGSMRVELRLEDLQKFAAQKFTQFTELSITSSGSRIVTSGKAAFAGLQVPFQVSGIPTVQEGSKLTLADPEVLVNGKPVDAAKALGMFKGFSSLLDLNKDLGANGAIHLMAFQVKGDLLIGTGTAQVPQPQTETSADSGSETATGIVAH